MSRYRILVFLVVVISLIGVTPASASPVDAGNCIASTEGVETDYAEVDAIVEQAPNRSNVVRITYKRLSSDTRLKIRLPSDVSVVRAEGFSRDADAATVVYTEGNQAILEYRIGMGSEKTQYANGSDWLFAPAPTHIGNGVNLEFEPNGVAGNEFLYIGNYTEYSTADGCHEISVVNSKAGNLPQSPNQILQALDYVSGNLDIGHKYEDVTIFLTPGFAQPPDYGFARDSDAWVSKSPLPNDQASYTRIVLHEYIHTRQAYNQGSIGGMYWIIEGSADYFSYKYALETGAVTPERYNNWLQNGSQRNAVLTNQSTWDSEYTPYVRGGAYLAVLDQRIQASSNRSLESVFHQINEVGGDDSHVLVQRSLFLETVENASSESVRTWANTTMDSKDTFDLSAAKSEAESASLLDESIRSFEQRFENKPFISFLIALMMGILIGMLPYQIREDNDEKLENEE